MDRLNQAATIGTINSGRGVANAYEIHDNARNANSDSQIQADAARNLT